MPGSFFTIFQSITPKPKQKIRIRVVSSYMSMITISALENMTLKELYNLAKEYKLVNYSKLSKKELIFAILKTRAEQEGFFFMEGVLEIIQSEVSDSCARSTIHQARRIFIFLHPRSAALICGTEIKFQGKFVRQKKMNAISDFFR